MKNNLNKLSHDYTRKIGKDIRVGGLKRAGIVFTGSMGVLLVINTLLAAYEAKITDAKFKHIWSDSVHQNGNTWICATVIFAIIAYLLSELEIAGARVRYKDYALLFIKKYMQNIKIDTANLDDKILHDVVDLLIKNMSNEEHGRLLNISVSFCTKLEGIDIADRESKEAAVAWAQTKVLEVIDSILAHNPGLGNFITDISTGKIMYNANLFMADNQKQK